MAAYVNIIPSRQKHKEVQKRGSLKSLKFFGRMGLRIQLSTSYFKQSETNSPGIMISPSPSILKAVSPWLLIQGKSNLRGRSMFLATVTITSEWQTQQRSQKNKIHSIGTAIVKARTPVYLRVLIAKKRAIRLLSSQCLLMIQRTEKDIINKGHNTYLIVFSIKF